VSRPICAVILSIAALILISPLFRRKPLPLIPT
jgi:hypothetical protein